MIVFLLLALLGFIASVAVQVSTFVGGHAVGMSQSWPLHVGIFIVFLPMALGQHRYRAEADGKGQSPRAPRWMGAVTGVCLAYAIVSFVLFVGAEGYRRDGNITTRDGKPVLVGHGQVVRTLGEAEYRAHDARVARGCSGYWMIFYWASFVGLYDGLARRRAARAAMPAFPALPASIRHTNSYERAPASRMSPWAHATVGSILSLIGFFALPMGVATVFLSAKPSGAGWFVLIAPLFFGAAIVGLSLPGALMSRYVAAACPACGGRAYADGGPLRSDGDRPVRYTCGECGRVSGVDGGVVGLEVESALS
jgi:hypothetical protein